MIVSEVYLLKDWTCIMCSVLSLLASAVGLQDEQVGFVNVEYIFMYNIVGIIKSRIKSMFSLHVLLQIMTLSTLDYDYSIVLWQTET